MSLTSLFLLLLIWLKKMEQGGSSKQQAINQRGRRQGVVRQAGHRSQEVEGRGGGNLFYI
jgi:hypothetical protein